MTIAYDRLGDGKPLLLVHGLGGSRRSWDTIVAPLAARRDVIVIDLPGFGATPPLAGEVSVATLADAVTDFLSAHELLGIDAVGSSMGARLVLELARRGVVGNVVSLDPGGFWNRSERILFGASIGVSIKLVRALRPVLPLFTGNPVLRTLLLAQFSARPWKLAGAVALTELRTFASSPSFDPLLEQLVRGPAQAGAATTRGRLAIGWGRSDRVCFPSQAARAQRAFPAARLHWFEKCGHFPQWDAPAETVALVLATTA